jgi:rhamnose utilization protein RhaD (predicted bifunctional aldolase and dehydrogenase)/NAD(P)-dependent dehydrogenase (short-subunit alcohol dehydrogenase family)
MKSAWNDSDAAHFAGDMGQRVYSSRLLGLDASLVLHGGGNTSVKLRELNVFGEEEEILNIKGRGANLATIDASGFSPCRLRHLKRLAELTMLTDEQMEDELKLSLIRPSAPAPSVETLLHAILPAKYVDHTHSDALISVMNTPSGADRVSEMYGDRVVIVPYVMPGFKLVRTSLKLFSTHATDKTVGLILMHHGLLTFGETARISYERMVELVDRAERYLADREAWKIEWQAPEQTRQPTRLEISALRRTVSDAAGAPMIMSTRTDAQALGFARLKDVLALSQRGGVTPDHVIRTKRIPMVGRDVAAYRAAYERYVEDNAVDRKAASVDPAPRVILDPELGLSVLGRSAHEASIAEDIYRHTIDIILRAEKLEGWQALSARDFFEMEYWDLERAKLKKPDTEPMLLGEIALVTGAASGIGKACVDALLERGAAVVGLDLSPAISGLHDRKDYLGLQCDLTNEQQIAGALEQAVSRFGGLDLLILNAGIFPKSSPVATLATEVWHKTLRINLDANLVLMRECHPLLKLAPRGGRVVIIGSKNVRAPGPGAAAYSASKAALQQLARVVALEWGADRIRVNTLHPNAVFDTGIWTPEVLASRAASYKLTPDEYKTNNVLKIEVTSRDVAELAAELCGPLFAKTTGAQIPIDGGNERVI